MRVLSPTTQVLKLGEDIVDSIRPGAGSTIFKLVFGVDIGRLFKVKGTSVRVSIYDREVPLAVRPLRVDLDGDALMSAGLQDSKEKERVTNVRDNFRLYSGIVDVTSFVKNDRSSAILGNTQQSYDILATLDSLSVVEESRVVPADVKVRSKDLSPEEIGKLVRLGTDPATLRYKFPVPDPRESLRHNNRLRKSPRDFANKIIEAEDRKERRAQGAIGGYTSRVADADVYKRGTLLTPYQEVYKEVVLPNSAVFNLTYLFIYIEALDGNGISIDHAAISHSLSDVAADVRRSRRAEMARTYARLLLPPRSNFLTSYNQISPDSEHLRLKLSGSPVIVRSVKGPTITGRVIPRKSPGRGKSEPGIDVIPFYIERKGDTLSIKVPRIPEGIIAVSLQRRRPRIREVYRVIGLESILVSEDSEASFVDTNLRDDEYYEYRLRFLTRSSNYRVTSNTVLYHYVSTLLSEQISAKISSATLSTKRDKSSEVPIVSFVVQRERNATGLESIRSDLSRAGLPDTIVQEDLSDPENYGKLIVYEVVRQNLNSGDFESFGVFSNPTFIDDSALSSSKSGVTPLNFYDKYRYVVRFGLRSPSSLTGFQKGTARDPKDGRVYEFNTYKFKSRRLSTNLPSVNEMSRKRVIRTKDVNIDRINTGVEAGLIIEPSDNQLKIVELNLRKTYVKSNLLTWKVTGDYGVVDHYQVYAEADGVRALLGSAHTFTKTGTYQYEDFQLYDRIGTVTYTVVPVLTNFTKSSGEAKVSVTMKSNLPNFLRELDAG